jgi:hypothetical protein
MYWLTRLDQLCGMFVFVFVVSMLTALALAVIGGILRAENSKGETGWETGRRLHAEMVPICLALAFLFGMLRSFTPTTAEMAAIIVVPKIVNNEKVQNVGNKIYDLAVEWMDELKPKKERR